jgi:hypothetical protein
MTKRFILLNLPLTPWLPTTMSPAIISSLRRRISSAGRPSRRWASSTFPATLANP